MKVDQNRPIPMRQTPPSAADTARQAAKERLARLTESLDEGNRVGNGGNVPGPGNQRDSALPPRLDGTPVAAMRHHMVDDGGGGGVDVAALMQQNQAAAANAAALRDQFAHKTSPPRIEQQLQAATDSPYRSGGMGVIDSMEQQQQQQQQQQANPFRRSSPQQQQQHDNFAPRDYEDDAPGSGGGSDQLAARDYDEEAESAFIPSVGSNDYGLPEPKQKALPNGTNPNNFFARAAVEAKKRAEEEQRRREKEEAEALAAEMEATALAAAAGGGNFGYGYNDNCRGDINRRPAMQSPAVAALRAGGPAGPGHSASPNSGTLDLKQELATAKARGEAAAKRVTARAAAEAELEKVQAKEEAREKLRELKAAGKTPAGLSPEREIEERMEHSKRMAAEEEAKFARLAEEDRQRELEEEREWERRAKAKSVAAAIKAAEAKAAATANGEMGQMAGRSPGGGLLPEAEGGPALRQREKDGNNPDWVTEVGDLKRQSVEAWINPWVQRGAVLPGVLRLCDGNDLREQLVEVAAQPADALHIGLENLKEQIRACQRVAQQVRDGGGGGLSEDPESERVRLEDVSALEFFVELTEESLRKLEREDRQRRAEMQLRSKLAGDGDSALGGAAKQGRFDSGGPIKRVTHPGDDAWRTPPKVTKSRELGEIETLQMEDDEGGSGGGEGAGPTDPEHEANAQLNRAQAKARAKAAKKAARETAAATAAVSVLISPGSLDISQSLNHFFLSACCTADMFVDQSFNHSHSPTMVGPVSLSSLKA
eukprot:COSAG05_NODE_1718_length_4222_cov_20.881972_2_plen_768_part_01